MNKNGRFRARKIYFTQVSNVALRKEGGLSLKARGLYGLIQSFITIPDFTLYKNHLLSECIEGKKSFDNSWKELKEKGFLIQYRLQDDKGYFYYEYELLDEPNSELINDTNNTKPQNLDKSTVKDDTIHNSKKGDMDKGVSGKGGVYNNTNPINTDKTNTYSNNNKGEAKVKFKGFKAIIENYTENKELQNTIVEFIKMRKANKSMLTDNALERLLNKLNALSNNVLEKIEILNNSILKSYRDIFPLETKAITNNNSTNNNFYNKSNNNTLNNKSNDLKFNNFESRQYDYDNLEKQLLGWV